jgi:hypothetical protein
MATPPAVLALSGRGHADLHAVLNFAVTEFHEVRLPWHLRNSRPTYVSCLRSITMPGCDRKGKLAARRGRKAYGPLKEVAGLPNRLERDQGWDQKEWEPSGALRSVLREMSLLPGTDRNRDLARLKPHLEEALETLERLERRRGLSDREKMRGGALRMLLTSIEEVQ